MVSEKWRQNVVRSWKCECKTDPCTCAVPTHHQVEFRPFSAGGRLMSGPRPPSLSSFVPSISCGNTAGANSTTDNKTRGGAAEREGPLSDTVEMGYRTTVCLDKCCLVTDMGQSRSLSLAGPNRNELQPADIGWPTGNRKKLSCCQAQLSQATCLAVAYLLSISCRPSYVRRLYYVTQNKSSCKVTSTLR